MNTRKQLAHLTAKNAKLCEAQRRRLHATQAGSNVSYGQRILVSALAAANTDAIVWQIQKISLVDCIRRAFIKHRPRNVSRGWQIYLPDGLFLQPRASISLRNLSGDRKLLDCSQFPPVALWAVIDALQLRYTLVIHPLLLSPEVR